MFPVCMPRQSYGREMATSQQTSKEFMLLLLLFISMRCAPSSQKDCSSFNAADYIGQDTEGLDISYGDCSFKNTFCNYTQACTSGVAKEWTETDGGAVCPGYSGQHDSFSDLLSPLLTITQNTSLVFNFSQTLPGTLSVFIVTSTEITLKLQEALTDGSFHTEVNIKPAVLKIGFRARTADTGRNVTLSYVKLQAETYTSSTTPMSTKHKSLTTSTIKTLGTSLTTTSTGSTRGTSLRTSSTGSTRGTSLRTSSTGSTRGTSLTTTSTDITDDTSLTNSLAEAGATSGSNVGVIVGVVVAVVVVVVAAVIFGFFIWRRRQQQENRRGGQKAVKGGENSYQNADTRNISPAITGMPSQYNLPTNHTVNSANASHKATPGISGIGSNQYDVPRNGIAHGHGVLKYDQSRPSELTCPTGDNEQDCYTTIEEDSDRDTLSQSNVYSYARNEGLNTSSSNNPEGNYDRTDTHGVVSDWQGKSSSAPPDDDYNHIVSTDRPREKTGLAAGKMESNYFLARGRDENDCDGKTSRNDDDEYSVLRDDNNQLSEFNGQQAAETYDHVGGDVHDDYDRIRHGDRTDVIGSDYDHVI